MKKKMQYYTKQDKNMTTAPFPVPTQASSSAPAPASVEKQITAILNRLESTPQESPEHAQAAKEFDQLIWGA